MTCTLCRAPATVLYLLATASGPLLRGRCLRCQQLTRNNR
jgi:hypothetical protein